MASPCHAHPSSTSLLLSSVQLLSHVRLFATPWIAAHQASLSITNTQSLPKLMSIESVMPSSHLILYRPFLLLPPIRPSIRVFSSESTFPWGGQCIGVSALASVLPITIDKIQDSKLDHSKGQAVSSPWCFAGLSLIDTIGFCLKKGGSDGGSTLQTQWRWFLKNKTTQILVNSNGARLPLIKLFSMWKVLLQDPFN